MGSRLKLIFPTLVGTGSILSSYGYSPLKQIQLGKVIYASELCALGATCFHLLSGVHPHQLWAERGYDCLNEWQNFTDWQMISLIVGLKNGLKM